MKKIVSLLVIIVLILTIIGCSSNKETTIKPIYRSIEEWKERYSLCEYKENEKLDFIPDGRPSVTCINGTFVGNTIDGIDIYKGIPYAKAPIGELRFQKAQPVATSNGIYDASYFGQSFMQPEDYLELASQYGMGEDCLRLNIWNNTANNNQAKPVLVFIHGGGFLSGGTSDPLYDGYNFVYYNPDIIMITVAYRAGVLGFVDLSDFDGSENYKYSKNNGFYDQIEALRWIKNNIKQFGGDPDNVTICGESAGGCFVSGLCVMDEAKGLFNKAIPMSGAVNLCIPIEKAKSLPKAIKEKFDASSVEDIQNIPFEELRAWWEKEYEALINDPIMDGETLGDNLFNLYKNGYAKDITILQGNTEDEFRYYYTVFNYCLPFYQAICDELVKSFEKKSRGNFDELFEKYRQILLDSGYAEEDINRCLADDITLKIYNTYQAILHANSGGTGYCYTFATPYDIKFDDFELGAAHAVDCYYLFGNFDGEFSFGTKDQVDTSIAFQKMIANFCKTGNPSTDEIEWPTFDDEHRYRMIINECDFKVVENPEKERVDVLLEMLDQFDTLYGLGLAPIIKAAYNNHPEAAKLYIDSLAKNK